MLALLWTDLDVENKTISVTKQVNRIKGELVVSQPKTQNSVRTLAIPQQAVDLLVEEHKKHPGNSYMFPSPKTGTMFDPDSFRHTHEKILKAPFSYSDHTQPHHRPVHLRLLYFQPLH